MDYAPRHEVIDDDTCLVELRGDADLYAAPETRERLMELIESGQRLVVDLSKLSTADETQLRVLLGVTERARQRDPDRAVVLVVPDESSRRVFEITGLDRIFSIYASRRDALVALGCSQEDQGDRVMAPPPYPAIEPPPSGVEARPDPPKRDQLGGRNAGGDAREKLLRELRHYADSDHPSFTQGRELRSQLIAYVERLPSDDERLVRLAQVDETLLHDGTPDHWTLVRLNDWPGEGYELFRWPTGSPSDLLARIVESIARVAEMGRDGSPPYLPREPVPGQPPDLDGWQVIEAADLALPPTGALRERVVRLINAGRRHVVLDVSRWPSPDFFPPIGPPVGSLAAIVEESGGSVVVIADEPAVNIFEVTGLDEKWPVLAARDRREAEELVAAVLSTSTDEVPATGEDEPADEVPAQAESAPVATPALDEVTRRGWRVVWGHTEYWGDVYWLEVLDSQGQKLATSMRVEDWNGVWVPWGGDIRWSRSLTGDPTPYDPSQAEPVDMDAQAELICAEAIRREQAHVDRWRSRSRLSRAWAAITGKDE